ncbi:MAG: PTS sugar transporter subunit IIA [Lentisphaeria bacterium]|nr:PTS sugar transporter subunit IIA [Lentisphaeria bacterium]
MSKDENNAKTITLGSLLSTDRVLLLKGKQQKQDVLEALIKVIADSGEYGSYDDIKWGIMHREDLMSTGIGNGIAIPHVLLPNVETPGMALALCPDGIPDYQSTDTVMIRMVFMLISGKNHQKTSHLKILSKIGSLFYDGRLKVAFLAAKDAEACLEILARAES